MDITGIGSIFDFGKTLLDKFIPDPAMKAKAMLDMATLAQTGELAKMASANGLVLAQIDVNKVEAASTNWFVAGWRPYVGWVCGTGLAFQFLIAPLGTWIAALAGHPVVFPPLDTGTLLTMLGGMLGIGGMRTYEKVKDAEGNR